MGKLGEAICREAQCREAHYWAIDALFYVQSDEVNALRARIDEALFATAEALGELESQAVDLHRRDIEEAKRRNKIAIDCLCKATSTLYNEPARAEGGRG